MGLPPKHELLAVFSSSDTVVGRSHTAVNRKQANISLNSVTELHSIPPSTEYMHG